MIEVIPESKSHALAIRDLTVEAFAASEFGHNGEADLIDSLRQKAAGCLSLVAVEEHHVIGHVLFSPATIETSDGTVHGMGLAPMSVSASRQRQGIGSRLVCDGLAMLQQIDCEFVVVAGHPSFYQRFGFQAAGALRLTHGFAEMPQEIFFVKCFDGLNPESLSGGQAFYHSVFGPQHR